MDRLNFSWVINSVLAGHEAPLTDGDLDFLKERGIQALVRTTELHKTRITRTQIESLGFKDCHEPVWVFTAPSPDQISRMVDFIHESVVRGEPVGVSCGAGHGRTGTILACYLIKVNHCSSGEQAIQEVRLMRPGSIETVEQEEAIINYALSLGKSIGNSTLSNQD